MVVRALKSITIISCLLLLGSSCQKLRCSPLPGIRPYGAVHALFRRHVRNDVRRRGAGSGHRARRPRVEPALSQDRPGGGRSRLCIDSVRIDLRQRFRIRRAGPSHMDVALERSHAHAVSRLAVGDPVHCAHARSHHLQPAIRGPANGSAALHRQAARRFHRIQFSFLQQYRGYNLCYDSTNRIHCWLQDKARRHHRKCHR